MATQVYQDVKSKHKSTNGTICERGEKDKCELDPIDSKFYQFYLDFLKNDIIDARSTVVATKTERKTADNSKTTIKCFQEKADATYKEYLRFDYYLASVFDQGSDDLKTKITALIAKDIALVAIYQRAHTAIKDLKKKTGELKDAACKLKYAIPDPCNSEQLKALTTQGIDKKDFETLISDAESVSEKASQAFEISVKVAGIHAYLNVAGLKPLSDAFSLSVDNFKADVDANIISSSAELKRTYTDYITQLRLRNTKECDLRVAKWRQYSLCKVKDFVCEPVCDVTDPEAQLAEICGDVEGKFVAECPPAAKKTDDEPHSSPKHQAPTPKTDW